MRKNHVLLAAVLMLTSISVARAQKAYVSVQQNDAAVTAVGTAAFGLSSSPTLEFVDGKVVMTVGDNTVAKLPMSDDGQLVVEFNGSVSNVSKTLTNGYATLYSPFQLQVPASSDVEVYAPTYAEPLLMINDSTKVVAGAIIPAGTGLLLKNASSTLSTSSINFTFSADAATDSHVSALSGSALKITRPYESGKKVYTLGHETDTNEYGFFVYKGEYMNPGLAYLHIASLQQLNANHVSFWFDDEITEINCIEASAKSNQAVKYIENGRVVILKNGRKYNVSGQEIK